MRKLKKIVMILVAFAVLFTGIPSITGTMEASAVARPATVKGIRQTGSAYSGIEIKWNKVKGANGYQIYLSNKESGKGFSKVKTTKSCKAKLKPLSNGKAWVKIRAYKSRKVTTYYNSKTKKWQKKKPAAKNWKGRKTKTSAVRICGKYSKAICVKEYEGPVNFKCTGATDTTLTFKWSKVKGYKGCVIYVRTSDGGNLQIKYFSGTTGTVTGLEPGTKYSIRASMYDANDDHSPDDVSISAKTKADGTGDDSDDIIIHYTFGEPKTATDYMGKTRTLTPRSDGKWKVSGADGDFIVDADEYPKYDNSVDGEWTTEIWDGTTSKWFQRNGTTIEIYDLNSETNKREVDVYGDASEVDFKVKDKMEPYYTYDYNKNPIVEYWSMNNGKKLASYYATKVTEQALSNGVSRTIKEACPGGTGFNTGTMTVDVMYRDEVLTTWHIPINPNANEDGLSPYNAKCWDICMKALGGQISGDYDKDMKTLAQYISKNYPYSGPDGFDCCKGAGILELLSDYGYGIEGFASYGSQGPGRPFYGTHVAFHLNSDPEKYYQTQGYNE